MEENRLKIWDRVKWKGTWNPDNVGVVRYFVHGWPVIEWVEPNYYSYFGNEWSACHPNAVVRCNDVPVTGEGAKSL